MFIIFLTHWQFKKKKRKFLAIFFEKMSSFWQFFESQMAIFRRVRSTLNTSTQCRSNWWRYSKRTEFNLKIGFFLTHYFYLNQHTIVPQCFLSDEYWQSLSFLFDSFWENSYCSQCSQGLSVIILNYKAPWSYVSKMKSNIYIIKWNFLYVFLSVPKYLEKYRTYSVKTNT